MARQESDREDFYAEAKALVRRVEFKVDGEEFNTLIGFRRAGSVSLYQGSNHVFHFNSQRELRRSFVNDLLYKAEGGQLFTLYRQRSQDMVALVRNNLTPEEQSGVLAEINLRVQALCKSINDGRFTLLRETPDNADIVNEFVRWTNEMSDPIGVAQSPQVS